MAVLLAEVVRRMRLRGRPEFELADIFMDFKAIQVTLAVMAQALIDGRIDCKTAGRLAIGLQTAVKLLRLIERKQATKDTRRHEERKGLAIADKLHKEEKARATKEERNKGTRLIPFFMGPRTSPYWARAA